MKKKLIYISLMAAGVMMAAGCAKESLPEAPAESKETAPANQVTFYASLPGQTKTAVDGSDNTKINWTNDDKINVFYEDGSKPAFTLSSDAGKASASFTGTAPEGKTALCALYPYNSGASNNAGTITTSVPNVQTVPAGSFAPSAALMVGLVSGSEITFRNAVAFLKITAPEDVNNLSSITITTNNRAKMTGGANFSAIDGAYSSTGTAYSYVTVKPEGGTFTAGAVYYAAVIPGTYSGLTISYLYKDNTTHRATEKSKSSSTALTMAAGHTKLISAVDMSSGNVTTRTAVQLRSSSPYYAEFNIGATITSYENATGYATSTVGGWYSYKGIQDRHSTNQRNPNATSDTATYFWGGNWCTPNWDQLWNELRNWGGYAWTSCDGSTTQYATGCTIKGWKVTGKDDYASNSIFLPAAGYRKENGKYYENGQGGKYSSTSLHSSSEVTNMDFLYNGSFQGKYSSTGWGLSVRAILANP